MAICQGETTASRSRKGVAEGKDEILLRGLKYVKSGA
jgi:hypothetical protein